MPSVTTWTRLEPLPVSDDLSLSLKAAVHDPLWLLGRQWQLGEFQGEDNGTPIWVELDANHFTLSRYLARRPDANARQDAIPYDHTTLPLESQVEKEQIAGREDYRLRVESGTHFLKLLAKLAGQYRTAYLRQVALEPLTEAQREVLDADTVRFVTLLAGRVIDGMRLYDALVAGGDIIQFAAPEDQEAVGQAAKDWQDKYGSLFVNSISSTSPWDGDRLEYTFGVSAPMPLLNSQGSQIMKETVLTAAEYTGGHLDWSSFSIDPQPGHALHLERELPASPGNSVTHVGLPTPVSYAGMPVSRFWEFEEGRINFGAVDTAPEDLGRMLMLEFALVYGNDFFLIPVELPVGTLCRIQRLQVTDTFGDTYQVRPASQTESASPWRMFVLSPEDVESSTSPVDTDFLFLPPVLGVSVEGQAVEEVLFVRDEMANLAWAIEREVQSPIGKPLKRYEIYAARRRPTENGQQPTGVDEEDAETAYYRVATAVPDYWYPLQPVQIDRVSREVRLELRVYSPNASPRGRLLDQNGVPFNLYEEEVPRAGVRVTRAYQYARWLDGSHHQWIGRRKHLGRGEASSGLRFDFLTPKSAD